MTTKAKIMLVISAVLIGTAVILAARELADLFEDIEYR